MIYIRINIEILMVTLFADLIFHALGISNFAVKIAPADSVYSNPNKCEFNAAPFVVFHLYSK